MLEKTGNHCDLMSHISKHPVPSAYQKPRSMRGTAMNAVKQRRRHLGMGSPVETALYGNPALSFARATPKPIGRSRHLALEKDGGWGIQEPSSVDADFSPASSRRDGKWSRTTSNFVGPKITTKSVHHYQRNRISHKFGGLIGFSKAPPIRAAQGSIHVQGQALTDAHDAAQHGLLKVRKRTRGIA